MDVFAEPNDGSHYQMALGPKSGAPHLSIEIDTTLNSAERVIYQ
jgi:hypothetical protein